MLIAPPGRGFDTAFGQIDLSARKAVLVALSGGSDSTALLVLFHEWLRQNHPEIRLVAVTVDHALRPEAADEARRMAEFCARSGIEHRIRRWESPRRGSGVAAAAREARYRLLAEVAREAGSDIILTGHTADDQAETVHMRMQRGEGAGLAAMARATLHDGWCWILRPLLAFRREELRAALRERGLGWIDDPGNLDPNQERIRARLALSASSGHRAMLELAAHTAQQRLELAVAAGRIIDCGARLAAPGLVQAGNGLRGPEVPSVHALRVLLACSGGRAHLPGVAETRRLQDCLKTGRAALGRTLATPRRDKFFLHREGRDLPPIDIEGIYDRRYRIESDALRLGWRLVRREDAGQSEASALERAALAAEPVLLAPPCAAMPPPEVMRYLAPFDHFLPGFDLAVAAAAARLYGRREYPPVPLRELTQCTRI